MRDRDLPPLNWLRAFEAAARSLSFTEAARELALTQAAVSKHVKSLELNLRQSLFVRHARRLELTKSGEAYLPKVQDALERLAIGTREVFGQRRGQALTVRCAVSFATTWLAPRLPDFFRRHPGVQLRLISSVWSDGFDAEAFDLDIQYGTGDWPGLNSHRLTTETITPLCDRKTARRLQSPDDLKNERLLHVLGYQEGWGIWLTKARAKHVDAGQGLHVDTSLMAYALAAEGAGIALGRSSLAAQILTEGRLVAPFKLEVPVKEGFYVLSPQAPTSHLDAEIFVSWLRDIAKPSRSHK